MTKTRNEVASEDKWDVERLYPSFEAWEKEFVSTSGPWHSLLAFKGRIKEGAHLLKDLLDKYFEVDRTLTKLYTFAHLKHDEDTTNPTYRAAHEKASLLAMAFSKELSWLTPEILSLSEKEAAAYLHAPELKLYHLFLEHIIRLKPHTLTAEKEELLSLSARACSTPSLAFSAFNSADIKFPPIKDSADKEHDLTVGLYSFYLHNKDRVLRKNAFHTIHRTYQSWENTLAELLQGQIQSRLFDAKARNYKTCLDAALFPHHIDLEVYKTLIHTVRENLSSLHEYLKLRKSILKVDPLYTYDTYVPMIEDVDFSFSYDEAVEEVVSSLAPLGSEYVQAASKGFKKERWVDKYENKGKRTGAYSSGCYDSSPYILMNYHGTIHDLFTLAHEMGHSMHSYLSCKNQPYVNSSYPIFVAEVASTFNEELLLRSLLKKVKDKKERAYLIDQKLESIRATFYRQTMFAEFELRTHTLVEEGTPLTAALLKEEYRKLNDAYFGGYVKLENEINIEWARIPHFYHSYYVYQYATGISAALTLADRVMDGGEKERQDYLGFLSSGGSAYPLDLLKKAGVDMKSPEPVQHTTLQFKFFTQELRDYLQ